MKKQLIGFNYKGKRIELEVRRVPFWYEGIGLMFTSKKNAKALLFSFKRPTRMSIFSMFIPYDFIAIWLDSSGKVIEFKIVKPGESRIKPKKKFTKLIEIPITKNYDAVTTLIVGEKV